MQSFSYYSDSDTPEEHYQKRDEFWRDCRAHFKYDTKFDEVGCHLMEEMAWQRGHANGFSEVFHELRELAAFAVALMPHVKSFPFTVETIDKNGENVIDTNGFPDRKSAWDYATFLVARGYRWNIKDAAGNDVPV